MVENDGLDKILFDRIVELNMNCNYHRLMEMYIKKLSYGEAIMSMVISEKFINPQNVAHGGAAYSLADTVMGVAIRTMNCFGLTVEMNMNYLKPVKLQDMLTGIGVVQNVGRRIIVTSAEVYNQNQELLTLGRGTFYNKGRFMNSV